MPEKKKPLVMPPEVRSFPKDVAAAVKRSGGDDQILVDRKNAVETARYLRRLIATWAGGGIKARGKSGRPLSSTRKEAENGRVRAARFYAKKKKQKP